MPIHAAYDDMYVRVVDVVMGDGNPAKLGMKVEFHLAHKASRIGL